ncbi:hypothetical protein [Yersinia mollaretii]|nr:hypothetical protein [Yersinia mollaretii]CNI85320.1 Uncharacterised protein [Yersinia mollaretii]
MNTDEAVLQFVKDELRCRQLQTDSSLSTGEHQTVPEDIYELMDKYSEKFNVD